MTVALTTITEAEYLELEKAAEVRHEFVDGAMVAMAGESRVHYRIARNLTRALEDQSSKTACEIVMEAVKVRVHAGRYRYPDVIVTCDPGKDPYFLENPCFIAEVLSGSTAPTDHNDKLEEYTRLPSLQRYAIVSQDVRRVIVYKRGVEGWIVEILEDGTIEIPCLETSVSLDQLYAGLELPTQRDDQPNAG
jgi:Uma2 family endonuclease